MVKMRQIEIKTKIINIILGTAIQHKYQQSRLPGMD
jgi:hypothetical protein